MKKDSTISQKCILLITIDNMSTEEWDFWRKVNESKKQKKKDNADNTAYTLISNGIDFKLKNSETHHYKIWPYDFWSSTGLFIHEKTKKRGRWILNLIKLITKN